MPFLNSFSESLHHGVGSRVCIVMPVYVNLEQFIRSSYKVTGFTHLLLSYQACISPELRKDSAKHFLPCGINGANVGRFYAQTPFVDKPDARIRRTMIINRKYITLQFLKYGYAYHGQLRCGRKIQMSKKIVRWWALCWNGPYILGRPRGMSMDWIDE